MIAHDPGNKPGYARFHGPTLVAVSKTFMDPPSPALFPWECDRRVIVEVPTGRGGNTKATPDNLIALALSAGRVIGRYEQLGQLVRTVTPNQWKGSVPKAIHHKRIRAALGEDELRLLVGATGDVIDAVGIGLWELGRLEGP